MYKYWIFFTIYWQMLLTYRFDITIYALTGMVTPLLGLFLWLAVQSGNGQLLYGRGEIIFYFLAVAWASIVTGTWGSVFIADNIHRGDIINHFVKPFSILVDWGFNNISEKVLKLVIVTPALGLIWWLFALNGQVRLPVQLELLPVGLLALLLGAVMVFLLDTVMGMTAFWVDETDFIINLYYILEIILGGKVVPLQFLPPYLQTISFWLPFRYVVSFPIELILGKLDLVQMVCGFVMTMFWIGVFYSLYRYLENQGVRRYQGYGR